MRREKDKWGRVLQNVISFAVASAFALMVPAFCSAAPTVAPAMKCADVAQLSLPRTQIISASETTGTDGNYCHVIGVIDKRVSAQDPDHDTYGIGFELNLPDAWIGRFEMQGGGGTDGSLADPKGSMRLELAQGWAVASDDGGHEDAPGNKALGWVDDDPKAGGAAHFGIDEQARVDFGYAGIADTTTISKQIIEHYYGNDPQYSYLIGCSNGGRDAMVAAKRDPGMFNGLVAGNPGFDLPRAAVAEAWNEQQLGTLATSTDVNGQPYIPPTFPSQDLEVASAAILGACDKLDGLVDGIIDDYTGCTDKLVYPALNAFTCGANGAHGNTPHGGQCLTSAQVEVLKKIYAGPRNSQGNPLYSSWYWDAGIWDPPSAFGGGWAMWNVSGFGAPKANNAVNLTLGAGAVPMVFTTPPVVTLVSGPDGQEAFIFHYSFDTDAPKIFASTPEYPESAMEYMTGTASGPSPSLTAFRKHGGKLIMYDSVNDGIFSGVDLVTYYKQLDKTTRHTADFARLFMIPNMAHCAGGPATTDFNANMLTAITGWVEKGIAPEEVIAANTSKTSPFPSSAPFDPQVAQNFPTGGTRPLCAYPKQARYKGTGSTKDSANFACVMPKGDHRH
ncbi:MAG TPA: tannase/feruloyl esterase family alpha/beta hydrolase [Candidatus Dormibacteraeota bacterium]|nr:tannase/feruloyl esterase family alpha/beta hydrolase [Candidatus Dormibacteraeota bacterium]